MEQITTHTKQIEQLNEIKIVGITKTTMNKPNELMYMTRMRSPITRNGRTMTMTTKRINQTK